VSFLTDVKTNAKEYRGKLEEVLTTNDTNDKEYNVSIKKYVSPRGQAIREAQAIIGAGIINIGRLIKLI